MSRLMSVALTEDAVRERRKTVTRRLGWRHLKPGDHLTLCRKVMGRRQGEPLVRIAEVEVVTVGFEPLSSIAPEDVAREGFPGMTPAEFVAFFTASMKCGPDEPVNRIEWRYLDTAPTAAPGAVSPVMCRFIRDGRRHPADAPHTPCCSSHGASLCCACYRTTHFVETTPCH